MTAPAGLRTGFLASCEKHPDRVALEAGGESWSYAKLREAAARIAATFDAAGIEAEGRLTAVFGHRTPWAFAGILGALFRGHGYVPLNPAFPVDRSRAMWVRSACHALVVDASAERSLDELLQGVDAGHVVLLPHRDDVSEWAGRWPAHRFLGAGDLAPAEAWRPGAVEADDLAYLLFTSGSTGQPKGVMVAQRNVRHFVACMVERYDVRETDRFSQMFDLTFDLSAFDMFVAWERGACVCVPTHGQKMVPASYIVDAGITIWFSVPSTGVVLKRLRKLAPGSYPGLRLSLFCGEALPGELVQSWAEAAANSVVENLYGPTELTIACTLYRWDAERSPGESHLGLVPIGEPYPGMEFRIVDESLEPVGADESGELVMTGPQLTLGYWRDPDKTAAAFVKLPGDERTFYRTGDRVRRPREDGPLVYLGRVDNQIKIQGYRVELGEIEAVLREIAGVDVAIAIGWPPTPSGADGIVAFLGTEDADLGRIKEQARGRLPAYMAPQRYRLVSDFPLNANGKVDRKQLRAQLEQDAEGQPA